MFLSFAAICKGEFIKQNENIDKWYKIQMKG